jgi:crossover junction endodeoxyribonuclease RuvC
VTIILGIDPGSRILGYGLIKTDGKIHHYLDSGQVSLHKFNFAERMQRIFTTVHELIATHQPSVAAVEQVFMHANINSALKLGQARGAAIAAIGFNHLSLHEYSPREIKKAVSGYGAASKDQIQKMVKILLKLKHFPDEDEADGLAIALCHANCQWVK